MIPTMLYVDDVSKLSGIQSANVLPTRAGWHTAREDLDPRPQHDNVIVHSISPSYPAVNVAFTYSPSADRMSPYINEPFGYCRSMGIQPVDNSDDEAGRGCGPVYSRTSELSRLQNIQDVSGVPLTVCWSDRLVASIVESTGLRTTFMYDTVSAAPLNLLSTIAWSTGRHTEYQYANLRVRETTDWMLTEVREQDGGRTSYTYSPDGCITGCSSHNPKVDNETSYIDGLQVKDGLVGAAPLLADGIVPNIRYIEPYAPRTPIATDDQCRLFVSTARACAGNAGISGTEREDFVYEFVHKMLVMLHDYPAKTAARIAAPGWLNRTAANLANDFADHVKLNVRRETSLTETIEHDVHRCIHDAEEWCAQPEAQLLANERRAWVKKAMRDLDPEERELVIRHAAYGEHLTEIAAATGRTPNAVGKEFNRLRRRLAMLLTRSGSYPDGDQHNRLK